MEHLPDFDIYAEDFGTLTAEAASTNLYARKKITDYVLGLTAVGPWNDME